MKHIFRVEKSHNYTSIHNNGANNRKLSYGARGLLWYLLSRPDDWEVRTKDLINASPAGRDAVQTLINELKTAGYMRREQTRDESGRLYWLTTIYEVPQTMTGKAGHGGEPSPENPVMVVEENTIAGKAGHILSTDKLSTNDSGEPPATPPILPKKKETEHQKLMRLYQEALGYSIPNGGKEGKAASALLRLKVPSKDRTYRPEEVIDCYNRLKSDDFWKDKHLSLHSVKEQIGALYTASGKKASVNGRKRGKGGEV